MGAEWDQIRLEIAELGCHTSTRRNDWSATIPCDWAPTTVENPETGIPFSDDSAWRLICKLLESGYEFHPVDMRKPPGEVGYETKIQLRCDLPVVYIKVQLRHGKAWGRSFHNDLRKEGAK
jgi:hypothetical protein